METEAIETTVEVSSTIDPKIIAGVALTAVAVVGGIVVLRKWRKRKAETTVIETETIEAE